MVAWLRRKRGGFIYLLILLIIQTSWVTRSKERVRGRWNIPGPGIPLRGIPSIWCGHAYLDKSLCRPAKGYMLNLLQFLGSLD
jgi:hypothetical protein